MIQTGEEISTALEKLVNAFQQKKRSGFKQLSLTGISAAGTTERPTNN